MITGTTSLFAALDTRTGKVIGRCHQRHRAATQIPRYHGEGYATHKTALIQEPSLTPTNLVDGLLSRKAYAVLDD